MRKEREAYEIVTKNAEETKKVAALLAREITKTEDGLPRAFVIGLIGDLGSGKTTFAQGFARALGITEHVLSPTFVLMRRYPLKKKGVFSHFIHIDGYRLRDQSELAQLGWRELAANPSNLILVEWADRLKTALPSDSLICSFSFHYDETTRVITIKETKKA